MNQIMAVMKAVVVRCTKNINTSAAMAGTTHFAAQAQFLCPHRPAVSCSRPSLCAPTESLRLFGRRIFDK
jgi:hypothetical protein